MINRVHLGGDLRGGNRVVGYRNCRHHRHRAPQQGWDGRLWMSVPAILLVCASMREAVSECIVDVAAWTRYEILCFFWHFYSNCDALLQSFQFFLIVV